MTEERLVTEVPSSLKQLARLVVRGFYSIEDALIIDMLVRNPCMKEDDICELLKFERKMLRARISTLKSDKFIQVRLKMETGPDGKAQKVNYYFINYKTFVNVVKYKLDLMRKRMETEERDATSRASFKCPNCGKTFTDLEISDSFRALVGAVGGPRVGSCDVEDGIVIAAKLLFALIGALDSNPAVKLFNIVLQADQLYDMMTQEFRCTFCNSVVEEDQSALPKKDSRLLLAKYNEQLEPLYILLREVEGIKLAPEILEPEPVDINTIRGLTNKQAAMRPAGAEWSGEATRGLGLAVEETRVDVSIGDQAEPVTNRKERPVWMMESTVQASDQSDSMNSSDVNMDKPSNISTKTSGKEKNDDIMSVLLAHEKQNTDNSAANALKAKAESSDSSDNESKDPFNLKDEMRAVDEMDSGESDSDDNVPTVMVNGKSVSLNDVNDDVIAQMTPTEKEAYIQVYQEFYSHLYD